MDRALHDLAAISPDLIDNANRIGSILWAPPRVVIVGRLKAGKSTLVNALVGARVAATAALEATSVVSIYQEGSPARAEAVLHNGQRLRAPAIKGTLSSLPAEADQISYLHRWLPSASIRDYTLIDTPGLGTLTTENDRRTRRVLIDGFEQTRVASVDADAAVFLFDSAPRADEIDFLRRLGVTPLNTLGVLSRADGFGEGALGVRDPLEHAAEHSRRLAADLAGTVMTVMPVAGLLAETTHTGALTEQDARHLAELAHFEPRELVSTLDRPDPAPLPAAVRDRLLDLLGEDGVLRGREIATQGAAALNAWLAERSGVPALRRILADELGAFARLHRAGRIVRELESLAYTHSARDEIRTVVDGLRTDPAVFDVVLLGHLTAMLGADPTSEVTTELRRMVENPTLPSKLGLPSTAGPDEITRTALDLRAQAHSRSLSTLTAAEDSALATLIHVYGHVGAGR
nr:GTPase [Dietzia aerolata]